MTIEEREEAFRREAQEVGKFIYTQEMISRFCNFWSEPDRAPGTRKRMKMEKEKTWHTGRRLATWARNNYDNIQVYLTDAEKSIARKRQDFAVQLEPYHPTKGKPNYPKYPITTLNSFWSFWSMPENKPNPEYLRWELEKFWNLETKLKQWHDRNLSQTPFK